MSETPALPRPDAAAGATTGDSLSGFLYALTAYLLWGFLPLYMKALAHIPPVEVIAHRVVWSLPIALAVLVWLGRTGDLKAALKSPRMLGMGAMTAALISVNWGIYVWAIGSGHALDAALGILHQPAVFDLSWGGAAGRADRADCKAWRLRWRSSRWRS
jgi:chloramphenicol-sensitive protein RarD